jgi:Mg-chelatase subunit ChlD
MRYASATTRHLLLALLLVVISPLGLPPAVTTHPAAAQDEDQEAGDDALTASTLTINVELILDASGSMAEDVPGTENQSRMEAAKAAMREVIARIPDREGLNVGFRVYGHEGSNSEADKALSCRSTELLVPLDGVHQAALLQQVETFAPTGWTPLALALTEAGQDFETGGESVTNAIILITDGEETCGGDPCEVAGQLHAADIALTTHVVGFALTREQRESVRCIAEEGGGQLFTAEDAGELSEAIFTAFTQVEATPALVEVAVEVGGYVGGNAFSLLGEAEDGALAVVAVGHNDGRHLPIVVQNNTGEDLEDLEVSATARVDGELITTGADQGLRPRVVKHGGLAFGDVFFSEELPADAEFAFELSASPMAEEEATTRDLNVEEVNGTEDGVIGILRNPHDVTVGDPNIIVALACFDETGQLLDVGEGPANKDAVEPEQTTPFEFGLPEMSAGLETETCPVYLVAGGGHVAS